MLLVGIHRRVDCIAHVARFREPLSPDNPAEYHDGAEQSAPYGKVEANPLTLRQPSVEPITTFGVGHCPLTR